MCSLYTICIRENPIVRRNPHFKASTDRSIGREDLFISADPDVFRSDTLRTVGVEVRFSVECSAVTAGGGTSRLQKGTVAERLFKPSSYNVRERLCGYFSNMAYSAFPRINPDRVRLVQPRQFNVNGARGTWQ
ncbi:hypothetical protein DPEC_G00315210 [Dallia pectoralis]|uniref:Uncharacterized protein n=1 Tax=Dallia pectoralis TaxID=75939 RepID=A0ACC2FCD2_DALPE|nr:hypothetical protein DPEC_G00315210 [Dallia pectoralis]